MTGGGAAAVWWPRGGSDTACHGEITATCLSVPLTADPVQHGPGPPGRAIPVCCRTSLTADKTPGTRQAGGHSSATCVHTSGFTAASERERECVHKMLEIITHRSGQIVILYHINRYLPPISGSLSAEHG